jgi:hypothetical protein
VNPLSLPEGGNENSPGWSVAQSGESTPNKSLRPVGAERDNFMPSSDVHAIALMQIRCPVFPASMNYDFKVEQFSSRLMLRRANALPSHRPFRSSRNRKGGAFTTTFSSGIKARTQVFSLLCLNPQNLHKRRAGTAVRRDRTGQARWQDNFESTEGVFH